MIKLEYFGSNERGQNVFDVRAGGQYLGQVVDRGRQGYRVFVGHYWCDFSTIHEFMRFFKHEAETP